MAKVRLLIGARQLQKFLQVKGQYTDPIDGIFGKHSQSAAVAYVRSVGIETLGWKMERFLIAVVQLVFAEFGLYDRSKVDGLPGPSTSYAQEQYQNLLRGTDPDEDETSTVSTVFPRYAQIKEFYGPAGEGNLARFPTPYALPLAWDLGSKRTFLKLNKKCGESAVGVLEAARDHYGLDGIRTLKLDLFGGDFNNRPMRGGSRKSTHAYGAALDWNPSENQFRWTDDQATLDENEYQKWWELWEAAGWVSLGRERNYDWMHVQAVRL